MLARRSSVDLFYKGINITKEVEKDLLSFEYTDNASGESDSVSITLKDEKHIWLNQWFPEKGDIILPTIFTTNWRKNGDKQRLPCGRFFIDQPEYSGRPSQITINGIASPLNGNFSGVSKSKVWKNITLKAIASDIASRAGLKLYYFGSDIPFYKKKEQSETSDSSFLSDLCTEESLGLKVTDSMIIIFDEKDFEKRKAVTTYKEKNDTVLDYSFTTSLANTSYAGVNVKFYDSTRKKLISFLYAPNEVDEKSKIYQLNKAVNSEDEARRLAQSTLRRLNKRETIANLSMVGNIELLGGVCINLEGFGSFNGKYFIDKAVHSIGGSYKTSIVAHKVLEGY